jgi:malate synthase
MARKPTRPRRNKARTSRASRAASANRSAKAGAKGARRGKPATKSRKSVATRKPAKRITSRSLPKRQRGTRASARAAGRRAAFGRNSPRHGAARLRRAAAPAGKGTAVAGVQVTGKPGPRYDEILTPDALAFLAELHRRFDATRKRLLAGRAARQARFDDGELPDFLHQTRHVRDGDWKIAPIPQDLLDRRVEITGPVDRKMIINALNSGANVYMADFEDANSPTWANNVEGQLNLKDRWAGKLAFTDAATGKKYAIDKNPAVLIVRPRGWHLAEQHLTVDGEPISGALFDFGLYYFHNATTLLARGTGPYFYLPKLESHIEARLWNDVFLHAQERFGHPKGTIKATVLIETLPAAFEMDEILWELRDHITGLNAGRWDYIFSFIKKFAKSSQFVLPDRSQVVMGKAFLRAYALLLIKTCHRRGAFAMGGMAAQIPVKNDPAANEAAFAKVRADKEREANDGHDGTWVAHPDLVPVAKQVFDRLMPKPNQLDRLREDVDVNRDMLLEIHEGTKTEAGFRENVRVGVQYIEAWLRGRGAVPIYNLMEDAATAEICRAQIWQWLTYGAVLENGVKVDDDFFERALKEEMERVKREVGARAYAGGRFPEAIELFRKLSLAEKFEEFLTIPAYQLIV